MSFPKTKPIIAITLGDPAGIGPEVVLKSLRDKQVRRACRPLLIGDAQTLDVKQYTNLPSIRIILNPVQAAFKDGAVDLLHIPFPASSEFHFGKQSRLTGLISALCVQKSVDLAMTKLVDGIVHAPISKTAWKAAGIRYAGQTEMIARFCGVRKFAMAIASGPLRTVMVTRHLPLHEVSRSLNKHKISEAIELAEEWMNRIGIHRPKIGVCALNPHAGENGLLGKEEIRIVAPAVRTMKRKSKSFISGPLPSDAAFRDHLKGAYDCLITLYHDQSMIPLKLFDPERIVNLTLGLPFPRTSPGHGTAFDIAGKNKADPNPMKEAILTCARIAQVKG